MKHYVDHSGNYLGGYNEGNPYEPRGAILVTVLPPDGINYIWKNEQWITKIQHLRNHLSNYRWLKETGSIIVNGLFIPTDDRSKLMLLGLYNKALIENNPSLIKEFKLPDGTFIQLTNQDIIDIEIAIISHVQKCFDVEKTVSSLINNGTLTTEEQVEIEYESQFGLI